MPPFGRFAWTWGGLAAGIAATAPLLVGLQWCLHTRWGPVRRLMESVEEKVRPLFACAGTPTLALVALLAGLGEEALFRGVIQDALGRHVPGWAAIVCASLLFGAAHWVTTTYAVVAGLVGLYLGILYELGDNLLAPIVTHALYDLVALRMLVRMKPAPAPSVV